MTSFMFEGPAIGGPANGRVLISHTKMFTVLYPVRVDATMRAHRALVSQQHIFAKFRLPANLLNIFCGAGRVLTTIVIGLQFWKPP